MNQERRDLVHQAIRSAYDQGFNDARSAGIDGYNGKEGAEERANSLSDLLARAERRLSSDEVQSLSILRDRLSDKEKEVQFYKSEIERVQKGLNDITSSLGVYPNV